MTAYPTTFTSAINTTLASEGWARLEASAPSADLASLVAGDLIGPEAAVIAMVATDRRRDHHPDRYGDR